ncbi:hypothetical protein PCANC_28480 [Puccinia coronata f. sp. avenae]|uniref:Uncharacterized protein n=1 Tax=Puccinia coronata f. sp. avenae TaxID=200324 RepID=A0A2N5RWR6_9BASI|nr:hypothetical protein PCANC_28480 [Puccinia coronata f. sp. avenae]
MANSNITIDPTLNSLMMTHTTTCTSPRKKNNAEVIPATEDTRTKKDDSRPSQEQITPSTAVELRPVLGRRQRCEGMDAVELPSGVSWYASRG